jgi:hypothetical protein
MTNKRLIKVALLTTGFMSLVAAGIALVRVRAQVAVVQPFVAIMVEEVAPRKDQPPTPITRTQTIAVRSDGSISRVTKWDVRLPSRVLYWREVIDARTKTHASVEDQTTTIVNDVYSDLQVLKPGTLCEGKPGGQVEGFDVVYSEHSMPGADNDSLLTHKQWNAPQLGCYPIVQEWVGKIHGQFNDTKQTLANIKLGEPDRWYFEVPANYTTRTADEWMELAKPLLKQ